MNSIYLTLYIVRYDRYIECVFDADTTFKTNIERMFEMTETDSWNYQIYDPLKMLFIKKDKTPSEYSLVSCRCLFVM